MNLIVVALTGLAVGAVLGLILGVPIGRRVERVAWYADATVARARVTGWLLRDLAGVALAAVGLILVAAAVIWTLLTAA